MSRSGASFRGLCPFHREKTPSFFVHPARQAFKCFGCGEGGSVFHFLMKARNLSFADSVEELAERYGVTVRYEGGPGRVRPKMRFYSGVAENGDLSHHDLALAEVPRRDGAAAAEGTPAPVVMDVCVDKDECVFPMVPAGGANKDMILAPPTREVREKAAKSQTGF